MGWSSGSSLAQELWDDIKSTLTDEQKKKVKKAIIKHFENYDCDTLEEVEW